MKVAPSDGQASPTQMQREGSLVGDKLGAPGVSQGGSLRWKVGTCMVSSPFTHQEEASAKSPGRTMVRGLLRAERRGDVSPTDSEKGTGVNVMHQPECCEGAHCHTSPGFCCCSWLVFCYFFSGDVSRP